MEARIDKDEWIDVWNSNTELRAQVKELQANILLLIDRVSALEESNPKTVSIYGKEVKVRE